MVTRVLLLRHGETELNRAGALRGRLDVPLSATGIGEAEQLASRISDDYRLSALHSSPLQRARETATEITRSTGLRARLDQRFDDLDYGPWTGRLPNTLTANERAEFQRWQRRPDIPLSGAEDPVAAQRRALSGLAQCAADHEGCIAIVTHDAILQLLLCSILSIEIQSYRGIAQHTATLNELELVAGAWRVRLLNSDWHLEGTR